jgi:hypothetical protein
VIGPFDTLLYPTVSKIHVRVTIYAGFLAMKPTDTTDARLKRLFMPIINNGPYARFCSATKLHHYIETIYIDKRYMCCVKCCSGTGEKRREILVSTCMLPPHYE